MSNSKPLSIGTVAKLAGVPLTTVRFYERANVVRPVGRTAANYRLYQANAVVLIHGDVDEAAFYKNALTPHQVIMHYQAGTNLATPYEQITARYWRFGEH